MKTKLLLFILITFLFIEISFKANAQSNYSISYPSFLWEQPSFGNVSTTNADDANFNLPLPFTFSFFGTCYTDCYVSTNGLMTFGSGSNAYANTCLPNASTP